MAKRRLNILEGNLGDVSKEPEEVVNMEENTENTENIENVEENISSEIKEIHMDEPVETEDILTENIKSIIKVGDRVKINNIGMDTVGRRIHLGVKNYVYTVKNIRPDGIACIECLTHIFNVKVSDLIKL